MYLKLDSVVVGRVLAGVVIVLTVVSASAGAAGTPGPGGSTFSWRGWPRPWGVGILIIGRPR